MHKKTLAKVASISALLVCPALALAAEAEHGGKPNLFDADIGNFIFTLIIFGAVVYILGKYAWRPVLNVLNEREASIRTALETAQRERQQAEQLLKDYQVQLERARQEATAIVEEGRRDAENVRQRLLEEARRESADMTERARREIKLATDTAAKELYDLTADLATQIAGKVVAKTLSAEDHKRLVEESLAAIRAEGRAKLN